MRVIKAGSLPGQNRRMPTVDAPAGNPTFANGHIAITLIQAARQPIQIVPGAGDSKVPA